MKIRIHPAEPTLGPFDVDGVNVEATVPDNGALIVTVEDADGLSRGGVIIAPGLWYKVEVIEPMDRAVSDAIQERRRAERRVRR